MSLKQRVTWKLEDLRRVPGSQPEQPTATTASAWLVAELLAFEQEREPNGQFGPVAAPVTPGPASTALSTTSTVASALVADLLR